MLCTRDLPCQGTQAGHLRTSVVSPDHPQQFCGSRQAVDTSDHQGRRGMGTGTAASKEGKSPLLQRITRQAAQRTSTRRHQPAMAAILQRDMLQEVLKFLTPRELATCASTCSMFRDVALSAALWKPHCEVRKLVYLTAGLQACIAPGLMWNCAATPARSPQRPSAHGCCCPGAVGGQGVRAGPAAGCCGQPDVRTGICAVAAACSNTTHHNNGAVRLSLAVQVRPCAQCALLSARG